MKGARPEQAVLSRDTDMSKTDETRAVIEGMVDGLNDHRIGDIGEFFAESFRWMGNQGCGTKTGLRAFQDNWQKPFQAAFSDKVCVDEARLYMGEWAAAFGRQEAVHSGPFMGIAAHRFGLLPRFMGFVAHAAIARSSPKTLVHGAVQPMNNFPFFKPTAQNNRSSPCIFSSY